MAFNKLAAAVRAVDTAIQHNLHTLQMEPLWKDLLEAARAACPPDSLIVPPNEPQFTFRPSSAEVRVYEVYHVAPAVYRYQDNEDCPGCLHGQNLHTCTRAILAYPRQSFRGFVRKDANKRGWRARPRTTQPWSALLPTRDAAARTLL